MQKATVQYGPPGRYFVRDEETQQPVQAFTYKSDAIAKAEELNGWPITGGEENYANSRYYASRKNETG